MNKTLTRKLIYVVAALTLLAMLIPAMAVPVSADAPPISLTMANPPGGADNGYNVVGSTVLAALPAGVLGDWNLSNPGIASFVSPTITPVQQNAVYVKGPAMVPGEVIISAVTASGNATKDKKWGLIDHTVMSGPATAPTTASVTWNETTQQWSASAKITDTVYGVFPGPTTNVMQGVILNWYLLPASLNVNMAAEEFNDHYVNGNLVRGLKYRFDQYLSNPVNLVSFAPWTGVQSRYVTNVTDNLGQNFITLYAKGEEAVQVLVIPEYPGDPQIMITPEKYTYNFYTTETETVPQVRWAGEKIVLEKYYGASFNGTWVKFSLENQSVGTLEGIVGGAIINNGAVWTPVMPNGFASVILTSSDAGVANVVAGLYKGIEGIYLYNQCYFTTYFLKFESIKIGDVPGKRAAHNAGLWNPENPNPWNADLDTPAQTLNVSQDALVRARVKGWFTSSNPSNRPVRIVNPADSSVAGDPAVVSNLTLPAGRWILPDDWAALAGPNWVQSRIHWDIMNTVGGNNLPTGGTEFIGAPAEYTTANFTVTPGVPRVEINNHQYGDYFIYLTKGGTTDYKYKPSPPAAPYSPYPKVALRDVIGPFSPGLEVMTPTGWVTSPSGYDTTYRPIHTVVPDGYLDWWDAPMPPAKVIFQIQKKTTTTANAGFFKAVNKADIYYVWAYNWIFNAQNDDPNDAYDQYVKVYTNPFYAEYIPAHPAIPAMIAGGTGYDWNSFATGTPIPYGTYKFWSFINQNRYLPLVTSADPAGHPTCVEVYSDNHGEAMVYVNGDWNLDLSAWTQTQKGSADVEYKAAVGTTYIQATVDYPYNRVHQAFQSNTDVKTWLWGNIVLGTGLPHKWGNNTNSTINTRMVITAGDWDTTTKIGNYPYESARSHNKMVFIWVTDRDGLAAGALGARVDWIISPSSFNGQMISTRGTMGGNYGLSQYNEITKKIYLENGFLAGTGGVADAGRVTGHSYLRTPTVDEKKLFNKFWGAGYTYNGTFYTPTSPILDEEGKALNPDDFCVAAIDVQDYSGASTYGNCNVTAIINSNIFDPNWDPSRTLPGAVYYDTNVYFNDLDPLDDAIRFGDANCDGQINMGDVTTVERMILGYQNVTTNAILNSEGTVDMGTVVKIERTILGLK